jgi:hypothetical protein
VKPTSASAGACVFGARRPWLALAEVGFECETYLGQARSGFCLEPQSTPTPFPALDLNPTYKLLLRVPCLAIPCNVPTGRLPGHGDWRVGAMAGEADVQAKWRERHVSDRQ